MARDPLPAWLRREPVPALVGTRDTESLVARPTSEAECREVLDYCRRNGLTVCPRGAGHSYGDLAQNDGHVLLDTRGMSRILGFDEHDAKIAVEGGVQIIDIYRLVHGRCFALPASPTEGLITVAGALAANVNGKDSWRVGNFADQVLSLRLMTADGSTMTVDRVTTPEVFRAVVGGMGLLGIVLEVTLQLRRIPSPYLEIARFTVADVKGLFHRLGRFEETADFIVAWVNTCVPGSRLGRSVIHATRWVSSDRTPEQLEQAVDAGIRRLATRRRRALAVFDAVGWCFALMLEAPKLPVRFFNALYYVYCKARRHLRIADNVEPFLRYNFDTSFTVPPASLTCGPRGYTIQALFPRRYAVEATTEMIGIFQRSPCPPVMTILRVHRADDQLISFSGDGYSLNFEIHPKKRHEQRMRAVVDELIDCVIRYGGKVHLAKDSVLTREQFRQLYPGYEAFLDVKRRLDPDGLFASDLYRRLVTDETPAPRPIEAARPAELTA